jgi:hypothetical protein
MLFLFLRAVFMFRDGTGRYLQIATSPPARLPHLSLHACPWVAVILDRKAIPSITQHFRICSSDSRESHSYRDRDYRLTFQAVVSSWSAGPPNANGTVTFFDGNILLATVPVNSIGQASFTTSSLIAGGHTLTATYGGGLNYGFGSSSVAITLTK